MRWTLTSRFVIKKNLSRNASRRAFSLLEFAIVLAIMGTVLGALWGVVSIVRENVHRRQMVDQMTTIVYQIRDFYANRVSVTDEGTSTVFDQVTDYLLRQSVLLPEQIRDRSAALLVADHPWGATAPDGSLITGGGVLVDGSTDSTRFFRIRLQGLKYSSCVAMASKLSGSSMPLGLFSLQINGGATVHTAFPVSPDEATGECDKTPSGKENMIDFVYLLRQPMG